jgi:drug/metabolite transporter (DMT)-like permease
MPSIKISNEGIPPMLAATLRDLVAAALLWAYASLKRERVFLSRKDIWHGVAIGLLFGLDFLFLYWGLSFTHASRAVIFLYTHPFWVAVGAHLLIANDRLTPAKGGGLVLAFGGLLFVFGSRSSTLGPLFWLGDLMEVGGAISWAATTLYIKKILETRRISHFQTLFAQLLFSVPVLACASWLLERGMPVSLDAPVLAAFLYQCLVVAFFSYLLWFWMIHRYTVSRLTVFTFLTPLFGVASSGLMLGEPLPLLLWVGLALVTGGIFLVNRPGEARTREGS